MLTPSLTDPQYLQHLLNKQGIKPNRAAGQNFLICPEPIEAVVAALRPDPTNIT